MYNIMKKIQNAQFKRVYFACQRNITPLHVHTMLLFTCVTVFVHHDGVFLILLLQWTCT